MNECDFFSCIFDQNCILVIFLNETCELSEIRIGVLGQVLGK
jgi:hypothetical protein